MRYNNDLSSFMSSLIFGFLFVSQQIIEFCLKPFSFTSNYWQIISVLIILSCFSLRRVSRRHKEPAIFLIICLFGVLFNTLKDGSLSTALLNSTFLIFGFLGFVYLSESRINLFVFDFILVVLYYIFYQQYFILDPFTRVLLDDDFFGHASSNAIPISLNLVLFLYFLLSRANITWKVNLKLFSFSVVNLILIILQGSRAGIVVSFILFLICFYSLFIHNRKLVNLLIFLILIIVAVYSFIFITTELNISELNLLAYQEDIRSDAHLSFFKNMDIHRFFFGYPYNYTFVSELTRTFNSFLDFWNNFGLISFIFFMWFFIKRIRLANRFSVPFIFFIPFLFYSYFERLWGGTLWDIWIFILLFYSSKNENYYQRNYKT